MKRLVSFSIALALLFIIVYALSTGLHVPKPRFSKMKFWPSRYSFSLLEPIEAGGEKLEQGKEMKVEKQSLVEDMKQCSLAMGMSRKELRRNMLNVTTVANKAQVFLTVLQSIIPANFSQDMKNPCWYSSFTLRTSPLFRVANKFSTRFIQTSGGSTELYCLPYFFIGGFPKSGTTTLHEALQQHPQIIGPTIKEPQWWTKFPLKDMRTDYLNLTVMKYLLYFTGAAKRNTQYPREGAITYDASQSTLWDSNFYLDNEDYCAMPAIVSRILPNAKFIVLM